MMKKYIIDVEAIQTSSNIWCYREISILNILDKRIEVIYCKPCLEIFVMNVYMEV